MSNYSTIVSNHDPKEIPKFCKRKQKRIYSFQDARRIARGHGFHSQTEFMEYECAGSYQLPKNVDELYQNEWKGWDDFLGVPLSYQEAKIVARQLGMLNKEDYLKLKGGKSKRCDDIDDDDDDLVLRLPYRPDLSYKKEWISWEDWLGI